MSYNNNMYELPKFKKLPKLTKTKRRIIRQIALTILLSCFFGVIAGIGSSVYFYSLIRDYMSGQNIDLPPVIEKNTTIKEYEPQVSVEEATIETVEQASPAVVSIIVSKDLPIFEQYYRDPFGDSPFRVPEYRMKGTEKQEIGGGTGFIVTRDGIVVTNKHVVLDEEADYTVFTNDGEKYEAEVLARDPFLDLAILKIETENKLNEEGQLSSGNFPVVKLGDSDSIKIGQTAIAIGNALGEYRNTVSVGVISGLGRTITATGGSFVETLEDVIQTDAAINKGNSGGPLLNLKGEVIGINTAVALEAQSIGFAIPINKAKRDIQQIKSLGKIVYPFLGIHYVLVTDQVKEEYNISADYGAYIISGEDTPGIIEGSAADKAGLLEEDIILEFDGKKITESRTLAKIISDYSPGDQVSLKVLRDGQEIVLSVILGERNE